MRGPQDQASRQPTARADECCLVLGGAGLVGMQVCRQVARQFHTPTVIVASLGHDEAAAACEALSDELPETNFVPESGNLFVPAHLAHASRSELLDDDATRRALLDHIFGDFDAAYECNTLATMILRHQPTVIVDAVNTATGISYQDVFGTTARVRELFDVAAEQEAAAAVDVPSAHPVGDALRREVEVLLMSQGAPQLIRHVRLLYQAACDAGTRVYVKVGTTGTGGMGLNIPYTHSEDRPSNKLLNKTEVAFGHTGLLYLAARTPDAPIIKEVKPAAMIGYRAVGYEQIRGPDGRPQHLYNPREVDLSSTVQLDLREDAKGYDDLGPLSTTVVNTGENGVFTRGEFVAITAIGQMEFVTPEEIARTVCLEIRGATTGRDVISALDAAVIEPSYRAGMIRNVATQDVAALEAAMNDHSVALGQLGPPELSKLLFEAHLIKETFGPQRDALLHVDGDPDRPRHPGAAAQAMAEVIVEHPISFRATSVGIPILLPDGETLLRGPRINVPELHGLSTVVQPSNQPDVDRWAKRGWVDLRPDNVARWQERFRRMIRARERVTEEGSAAFTLETYLGQEIEIGDLVAWIFNNEMGGSRLF